MTHLATQNPIGRTGLVGLGKLAKVGANRVDVFIVVLNNPRKVLVEVTRQTSEHVDHERLALPFQLLDFDTTQNRRRTLEDELGNNFKILSPEYVTVDSGLNTDNAWLDGKQLEFKLDYQLN